MKNKKAIIALALGLTLSLIPSCESKSLETGAFVSDSQSVLSSEEAFISSLNNLEMVDTISVLTYPEEHSLKECQKAAYDYLISHNINPSDIKTIWDNIIVFGNNPMCLDEKEYAELLGILAKDLPENINAFTAFYPFALAYHESYCELKHQNNTCEALDSLWSQMGPINLEAILDLELNEEVLYQRLKESSIILSISMESYIDELLTLGEISLSSSISEENLRMCFPFLSRTLKQNENLLDTYYTLSQMVISVVTRGEGPLEANFSLK